MRFFPFLITILFLGVSISSCSEKLDASKIEKVNLEFTEKGFPISITLPKTHNLVIDDSSSDDDLLSMLEAKTAYVNAEHFNIVISSAELMGETKESIIEDLKKQENFNKVEKELGNGVLFSLKEINNEVNFSFKLIEIKNDELITIVPQPKSEGNYTLEEINYMLSVMGVQ